MTEYVEQSGRRRLKVVFILVALVVLASTLAAIFGHRAFTPVPFPRAGGQAKLTVEVSGAANAKGQVMAAVCDEASFLKVCPYMLTQKGAAKLTFQFEKIKPGRYAVMLFHDENGNGAFDKSANGMPLEGYGFSRNAKGHFGPPSFDEAAIDIKPGMDPISIELAY